VQKEKRKNKGERKNAIGQDKIGQQKSKKRIELNEKLNKKIEIEK
jgi:hypothetical protein